MKNKKGILITAVVVLALIVISAFASRVSGIGGFFSKIGEKYAATKANDKVVATVNGKPVYLSIVKLQYLTAKKAYSLQLPEFKKNLPDNYEKFIKKPDPFKYLNSDIDNILLSEYVKKKGIKVDSRYLQNLTEQQKKDFFYSINGMPESEMNKMSKTDQEIFKLASKITKDIVKDSGMSPEEFFKKKGIPSFEDSARMESFKEQLAKSIKAPKISEEEIKNYMNLRKGVTKSEAISALEKQKIQSIADEKVKNLISNLRKTADIKIIDREDLEKLAQDP